MKKSYDPKQYWEERIKAQPNLHGTGHQRFDLNYNLWLYQTQVECLDEILNRWTIEVYGKSVLDIGSGTGFFVEYFQNRKANTITGIDLTQASVNFLEKKFPGLSFITADIANENLPIQGAFDIISAMGVLYHIIERERFQQALRNLCGLLSLGGYVFITDSFVNTIFPSAHHARLRPIEEYQLVFADENVKILELLPLYYFLNRTYLPWVGPWLINTLHLGQWLYRLDRRLRQKNQPNGGGLKILLAKKELQTL